jgi:hypothetical protein
MINLPTIEETTRTYNINGQTVSFELIELDELHKVSSQIANKNKTDFYDVFNALLSDKKKVTLSKAAIYLILLKKSEDFEELKKRLSPSEHLLNPLDSPTMLTAEQ